MRISAKADDAVRALVELAAAGPGATRSTRELAEDQGIPLHFLENILGDLRRAGLVEIHRGAGGGSSLARPAAAITVGQIVRAMDGPLAAVRDLAPDELVYGGAARNLPAVWREMHACINELLDGVSVADLVPDRVDGLNMT